MMIVQSPDYPVLEAGGFVRRERASIGDIGVWGLY